MEQLLQRVEFLEVQQEATNSLYERVDTLESYEEWQGATLRKLPLWADDYAEDIENFQWPTE